MSEFDPASISQWLSVLHAPGEVVEIRILESNKKTTAGYFNDFDLAAAAVRRHDGAHAIYAVLNTVNPDLLARASNRLEPFLTPLTNDKDITRRRWLMVDFDPVRPAGISATDAEHNAAHERAVAVGKHLKQQGFPVPVLADSGNGWHLLYRLDLPNDNETRDLLDKCLQALDLQFSDGAVNVDRTTFNASRICKLYGTMANKGDSTPDRSHRRASIHHAPKDPQIVPLELLQELAATMPAPVAAPVRVVTGFDLDEWIARHNLPVEKSGPWNGGYKWILNPCPWDMNHTNGGAFILQFPGGGIAAGCRHNGCHGRTWHDLRTMYEPDAYDAPTPTDAPRHQEARPRFDQIVSSAGGPRLRRDVNAEPVAPDEEWETPIPFGDDALLDFPLHVLPSVLADHVAQVAASIQVPVDMPAMLALCCVSAMTSRRCRVHVGDRAGSHEETLNLYTVIASDPGTRKSAAMAPMVKPLEEIEDALHLEKADAHAIAVAHYEAEQKRKVTLQGNAAREKDEFNRRLILDEVATLVEQLEEPPSLPRLLVQDITMEKLANKLAEQEDNCLAQISPEGGALSIIKGQYAKKDAAPNMDIYLKGYTGERHRIDRVSTEDKIIRAPMLTMGLMVQHSVLRSLAEDERLHGNGFLGRFLYSVPKSLVGTRLYQTGGHGDSSAAWAYNRTIKALYNLPKPMTAEDPGKRFTIYMDAEAIEVYAKFYDEIERRQAPGQDLAQIAGWASKLHGNVARIAGNLHMVKHLDGGEPWKELISGETMAAAWAIGYYCVAHAIEAFGMMHSDVTGALADRILGWVIRKNLRMFSLRDAWTSMRPKNKAEVELALGRLTEHCYVRLETPRKLDGKGRPPKPAYAVNPCLWEESRPRLVA